MSRLTRKTNARDYCSYCRVVELLIEREQKPKDDFYDDPKQYYERWPYQEAVCGDDEERLIKLGKLEDLMEEYELDSVEELENALAVKVVAGGMRSSGKSIVAKGILYNELSEELGCPLDVVFKKIKELELQYPFSLISICKWNGKWSILEIEQIREDDFACYVKCYLQNYNKTWWLKGEKNV